MKISHPASWTQRQHMSHVTLLTIIRQAKSSFVSKLSGYRVWKLVLRQCDLFEGIRVKAACRTVNRLPKPFDMLWRILVQREAPVTIPKSHERSDVFLFCFRLGAYYNRLINWKSSMLSAMVLPHTSWVRFTMKRPWEPFNCDAKLLDHDARHLSLYTKLLYLEIQQRAY